MVAEYTRPQGWQQYIAHLGDDLDAAIITLHEDFAGAACRSIDYAVMFRQIALIIEKQAILATSGQIMQTGAQVEQKMLETLDMPHFGRVQKTRVHQIAPIFADGSRARQPAQIVQITQTAGTFLEIGLQLISAVIESRMTLILFGQLAFEKAALIELRSEA